MTRSIYRRCAHPARLAIFAATLATAGALALAPAALRADDGEAAGEGKTPAPASAPSEAELEARGRALIRHLADGSLDEAVAGFDKTMRTALPPKKLGEVWAGMVKQLGALNDMGAARVQTLGEHTAVIVRCRLGATEIDGRVVFNADGTVAGLLFMPVNTRTDPGPPAYADPATFDEHARTIGVEGWPLGATLSLPKGDGPFPAVVLVHGSGPHDRDSWVFGVKVFRDLAWGLASRGVAVLRYEKRTRAHPTRFTDDMGIEEETIIDALAAASALRKEARIDPAQVYVAGLSLGAMCAPAIALRDDEIAGAVLLAGAARRLEEVLLEQTVTLALADGEIDADELEGIALTRQVVQDLAARRYAEGERTPGGLPAGYFYRLHAVDPVAQARALARPLLIVQGGRDFQVSAAHDYLAFREGLADRDDVSFRLYPKLNHLFVAGEGPSSLEEYKTPSHVDARLVDDLATWLRTGALAE